MDVLLDTHVALWWADDPDRLAAGCVEVLSDPGNGVWFSAASAWELAIKVRQGKLAADAPRFLAQLRAHGVRFLSIAIDDAVDAGMLDWAHRDPFDRMLVAQATARSLVLASRDDAIVDLLGDRALRA